MIIKYTQWKYIHIHVNDTITERIYLYERGHQLAADQGRSTQP
jgi:hypothetical protein